ncbi:MAG: cob(I)yrinic acid a,c-diamide adenosyltransferase [Acidobacteria bacterium]|nr:cob(I)yrinic acid a,c-diamide adenosyltransferase [Acidobacteriota bacterium]MDA1233696.1 cob(I)yrinic acid a,c-diamide adenosyltransferase [Acidobacteriota bacterium]
MSIATKRGDAGQTGLAGGIRVSKNSMRVEGYGTIDELISSIGFARSICPDEPIRTLLKEVQRELFSLGSALATPPESSKKPPVITAEMVERLTSEIHRVEAVEGVLADWSIPGEHPVSAALDVARTICRRAERQAVALKESGEDVAAEILAYLNRLSDLLWIQGRLVELEVGVDAALRTEGNAGPRWSRAW